MDPTLITMHSKYEKKINNHLDKLNQLVNLDIYYIH